MKPRKRKRKSWKLGKNCIRIIGHPGTGKTTALSNITLSLINRYGLEYCAHHLLGVSFSNSAAEALREALKWREIDIEKLKYVRTIHSLGARVLNLDREEYFVLPGDSEWFMNRYGIPCKKHMKTLDDIRMYGYVGEMDTGMLGNTILNWFQYLKRILIDEKRVKEAIEFHQEIPSMMIRDLSRLSGEYLLSIYEEWESWKEEKGKYEYDDMLQEIYEREIMIDEEISYGLIDEAQDLTPLQYTVLGIWLKDTEWVYIAGDEMQTMYRYQGARPELLSNLECNEERVLDESYRVPRLPWECAKEVAHENRCYTVDCVEPTAEEGDVLFTNEERVLRMIQERKYGDMYVLFRSNREAFEFLDLCLSNGFLPQGLGRITTRASDIIFVLQYELMRKLYRDRQLNYSEVRALLIQLPVNYLKKGVKTAFRRGRRDYWFRDNEQLTEESDTHALFFTLFNDINSVKELKEIISDPNVRLGKGESGRYKKEMLLKVNPNTPSLKRVNAWVGTYHSAKGLECDNTVLFDYLIPKHASLADERCLVFTGLTRTREGDFIVPVNKYSGIIEKILSMKGGIEWWDE